MVEFFEKGAAMTIPQEAALEAASRKRSQAIDILESLANNRLMDDEAKDAVAEATRKLRATQTRPPSPPSPS